MPEQSEVLHIQKSQQSQGCESVEEDDRTSPPEERDGPTQNWVCRQVIPRRARWFQYGAGKGKERVCQATDDARVAIGFEVEDGLCCVPAVGRGDHPER